MMTSSSIRSILNIALAVWVALVLIRFTGADLGLPVNIIDRLGLQVLFLGVCLALAAVDAALGRRSRRDEELSDG